MDQFSCQEQSAGARCQGPGAGDWGNFGFWIDSACRPVPTAHCPLATAYCLLPTAHCVLPTAHCLPFLPSPQPESPLLPSSPFHETLDGAWLPFEACTIKTRSPGLTALFRVQHSA